jgi:hypothetical protein
MRGAAVTGALTVCDAKRKLVKNPQSDMAGSSSHLTDPAAHICTASATLAVKSELLIPTRGSSDKLVSHLLSCQHTDRLSRTPSFH